MNESEQLIKLANAMIDGTARPADAAQLSTLLRDRAELRDAYLRYLDTHAALCWYFRDRSSTGAPANPVASSGSGKSRRRTALASWIPWFVAVVAIGFAVGAFLWRGEPERIAPPVALATGPVAPADGIMALIVDEVGAEFSPGHGPDGIRVGSGQFELQKGLVHLRFTQGADMVLVGPARLDVRDAQHVRLMYGDVRVTAPPKAKGFTMATRDVDYVDLGTEFGLRVDRNSGTSDLYVFDGQVNVASPQSGEVLSEVMGGQSSRCLDGKLEIAPEIKEGDFPTPGAIGLKRWEKYELEMRKDPTLLAFFPFHRTGDGTELVNGLRDDAMADDAMANGRVVGARWTTGRWPGKEALLFDRDTDYVQIELPGEHQELTLAAWLKVDRLDFVLNAILNSDGYEPGGIHFQMTRQGFLLGGLIVEGNFQYGVDGNPVRLGGWVHVASVISTRTRSQQIYMNGALAREHRWPGDQVLRPGSCRIGNWLADLKDLFPKRSFRGQMDELAIWSRALPAAEVGRLVEAGRPALVWNKE